MTTRWSLEELGTGKNVWQREQAESLRFVEQLPAVLDTPSSAAVMTVVGTETGTLVRSIANVRPADAARSLHHL